MCSALIFHVNYSVTILLTSTKFTILYLFCTLLGSQLLLEPIGLEHLLLTFSYSILSKISLLSATSQV